MAKARILAQMGFAIASSCGMVAPDQNRTDTGSLEGYCSTIELQAQTHESHFYLNRPFFPR